jgi:quercetin dioxygenase-like cupin family protein
LPFRIVLRDERESAPRPMCRRAPRRTFVETGKRRELMATTIEATEATLLHRPADSGPSYWGPGDRYTFLVTGEESGGAYFAMEAYVPPGGGPPPHVHTREDETFYVLEGKLQFLLGDRCVVAGPGDFVSVPRGTVHCFTNGGTERAQMILTFTPAGIEGFFEESLETASNGADDVPGNLEEVAARYAEAAPRYGMTFV